MAVPPNDPAATAPHKPTIAEPNDPTTTPNRPLTAEIESLRGLRAALERIGPDDYGKYQALLRAIRGGEPFTWRPRDARDRLVVFTERIETLRWLRDRLREDLGLDPDQLAILHGGMSDVDQQRVVEDFGNAARPVRLLLCSDVASEGINLHYHCHRLIHFDMPWSLMVFQQRNGRVDRYGQERTPRIVYLVTESANETIRGDTRILEVLERKDEQAYRDIGDPSAFMNVHDVEAEEDVTRRAIAGGEGAEHFDARLAPASNEGEDLLALFLGTAGGGDAGNGGDGGDSGTGRRAAVEEPTANGARTAGAGSAAPASASGAAGSVSGAAGPVSGSDTAPAASGAAPSPPPSLFASDLAYCEAALHRLREKDRALRFETDAAGTALTLDAWGNARQDDDGTEHGQPETRRQRPAHLRAGLHEREVPSGASAARVPLRYGPGHHPARGPQRDSEPALLGLGRLLSERAAGRGRLRCGDGRAAAEPPAAGGPGALRLKAMLDTNTCLYAMRRARGFAPRLPLRD